MRIAETAENRSFTICKLGRKVPVITLNKIHIDTNGNYTMYIQVIDLFPHMIYVLERCGHDATVSFSLFLF